MRLLGCIRSMVVLTLLCASASNVQAHSLGLSVVKLMEAGSGRFVLHWLPSETVAQRGYTPKFTGSGGCSFAAPYLTCAKGETGRLRVDGLPRHAELMLAVSYRNGDQHYSSVYNQAIDITELVSQASASGGSVFSSYLITGVEHILGGFDHLLFVVALLFIVGLNRRIIATITAFTLAHSITISLGSLGLLSLPVAATEATIALSIVLAFRETLTKGRTLSRRYPWLIAFLFGLVHGVGFASALNEIGLPDGHRMSALLGFNLGVEAGQLMVLALIALVVYSSKYFAQPKTNKSITDAVYLSCYLFGGVATFWAVERSFEVLF